MGDDVLSEIMALAKRHTGRDDIHPGTLLFSDLGMDGDDADEFLIEFSKRFEVDLTALHWLRYFGDEGFNPLQPALAALARWTSADFRRRWRAAHDAEREISLAHLAQVASAKRWIESSETRPTKPKSVVIAVIFTLFVLVACVSVLLYLLVAIIILMGVLVSRDFSLFAEHPWLAFGLIAVIGMFGLLIWNAWHNIQRKLASAPPAASEHG